MKNLLFFASDFKIGLSALLTDQLCALSTAGANVIAVAGENEQEPGLTELVDKFHIKIIRINGLDTHKEFPRLVRDISEIIRKYEIDIIHVQNNWQLAIAGMAKNQLRFKKKTKIVYTLHGFRHNHPVKAKIAQVIIGSALLVLADNVICMTQYLKSKFKLLSYKIKLIPLGVKEDYFTEKFSEPNSDHLRLIFPAQFREGKNQDMIINAFSEFVNQTQDKNALLILPGNGPLLEKMKTLVLSLKLEKQVLFPGFVSKNQIKELYLESNVAIVASNSETFGQSIVEPFVLGRCVVSTLVGITPEIIKNGENGYIFKTESDLTAILVKINENKSVLYKMGKRNFDSRNLFRWDNITKQYIKEFLK